MGAALAYYTMFSIAPLLLIVISVAGLVFGEEAARGEIFAQLARADGRRRRARRCRACCESVNKPAEGIVATLIGVVLLVVGATTVFGELQDALDRIWRAPARDEAAACWALLRARLLSFGMIMGIGFLLMVSLVLERGAGGARQVVGAGVRRLGDAGCSVVNFVVSFVLVDGRVRDDLQDHAARAGRTGATSGSAPRVTALLFTIGKFLIGLYIGKSGVASGFGAAGSLVVVLVWVYYSAQIFLLGAEFTWVYAHTLRLAAQRGGRRRGGSEGSRHRRGAGAQRRSAGASDRCPARRERSTARPRARRRDRDARRRRRRRRRPLPYAF